MNKIVMKPIVICTMIGGHNVDFWKNE